MKKRIVSLILVLVMMFSLMPVFETDASAASNRLSIAPYATIDFVNSKTSVAVGHCRAITQNPNDSMFVNAYWGKWNYCAGSECGTTSISMALSYIGIDVTPEDVLNYNFNTTFARNWGGASYDLNSSFDTMMSNYINSSHGVYSPPIIHLDNYSSNGHYVCIVGKYSTSSYVALDPWTGGTFDIQIVPDGNYYKLSYKGITETTNFIYSSKTNVCKCQYYNPNANIAPPFPDNIVKQTIPTNISVITNVKEGKLWTLPCNSDTNNKSVNKYTVPRNTVFDVKRIILNSQNNYWYEVTYKGNKYYLFSERTELYAYSKDITISSPRLPTNINAKATFSVGGIISSKSGINCITGVYAQICDKNGTTVDDASVSFNNAVSSYNIAWPSDIDVGLEFNKLPAGTSATNKTATYSMNISASYSLPYACGKQLLYYKANQNLITGATFTVTGVTKTYKVTFDANGADISKKTVEIVQGETLKSLPTVSRKYYDFLGWYTEKTGGTKVSINTTVSKDTVLYAHWKGQSFTVDVDYNGGKTSPDSNESSCQITYTIGEPIGDLPELSMRGYSLVGFIPTFWDKPSDDIYDYMIISSSTVLNSRVYDIRAAWSKTEYRFEDGSSIYFDIATNSVIGATYDIKYAEIPSEIEGVPVKTIASNAFNHCIHMESVSIPKTVTTIEENAFVKCSSLETISIPDSVKTIDDFAFNQCKSLKSISFGANVNNISSNTFKDCTSLQSISFSTSNKYYCTIDSSIYSKDGTKLILALPNDDSSYSMPDTVIEIAEGAFDLFGNLESINVSESNSCFSSIDGILYSKDKTKLLLCPTAKSGSVIVPDTVTQIADSAFEGCESIDEVLLPNNLVSIGEKCFENCGITNVVLPASLTQIPDSAFCSCCELANILVQNGIESIGENAFNNCKKLKLVILPESVKQIGTDAFKDDTIDVYFLGDAPQMACSQDDYKNCKFHLTKDVYDKIDATTCPYYDRIVDPNEPDNFAISVKNEKDINGSTYEFVFDILTGTVLKMDTVSSTLSVPAEIYGITVRRIGDNAFGNEESIWDDEPLRYRLHAYDMLSAVELPYTIESIGAKAFKGCMSLEQIDIPSSVTSIGEAAFSGCYKLKYISLPQGVEEIPKCAFYGSGLEEIECKGTILSIGESAFYMCKSLNRANVFDAVTEIGKNAFCGTQLKYVTIPKTTEAIGEAAFMHSNPYFNVDSGNSNYSSVDGVLYDSSLTHLISYPKASPSGSFVIPDSVATIERGAFADVSGLSQISMPVSVKEIEQSAFVAGDGKPHQIVVLYDGTRNQWAGISIGTENENLTNARILYNTDYLDTDATIDSFGDCGEGVHWLLYSDHTLYIYGSGDIYDYDSSTQTPFWSKSYIKSVIVQNGITHIGKNLLADAENLESVVLPKTVFSIGDRAFCFCKKLTSIVIPKNVETIGNLAFYGCTALKNVSLPDELVSIGGNAFEYTALDNISLPDELTSIGASAFANTSIESIVIPEKVNAVSSRVFENCISLNSVKLNGNIESVGEKAFYNTKIESLDLPDVKTIAKEAFANCSELSELSIGDGVESIAADCVIGSSKLHDIYYGGTIESWSRFNLTRNVARVHCIDGDTEPAEIASGIDMYNPDVQWKLLADGTMTVSGSGLAYFNNPNTWESTLSYYKDRIETVILEEGIDTVYWLTDLPELTTVYVPGSCETCPWLTDCPSLKNVYISEGVEYVELDGFEGCTSLEELYIPSSVKSVYSNDYDVVISSLQRYVVSPDNHNLCSKDGLLFSKDMKRLELYPFGKTDASYTIPDGVETIGACAFSGATNLTSVTIPDGVKTIEPYAFSGATNLTSVTISEGVKTIDSYAFSGATSLTTITIPASVQTINEGAFMGCTGLKSAVFMGNPPNIGQYGQFSKIFYADENHTLSPFTLYYYDISGYTMRYNEAGDYYTYTTNYNSYTDYWRKGDWAEYTKKELHLLGPYEEHALEVENGYIYYKPAYGEITGADKSITWAEIPEELDGCKITEIGEKAFENCTNLTGILLPDTVTIIGDSAFSGCKSLKDLNWPNELQAIYGHAFSGCCKLTDFDLPNLLVHIGDYTFEGCSGMHNITLGNSLQTIGSYAFTNGPDLKSVVFPESLTSIDYCAFDCENLEDVLFLGDEPSVYRSFPSYPYVHYYCYSNGWGENPASDWQGIYPSADHSFHSEYTEPTCTKQGYTTLRCDDCGYSYTYDDLNSKPLGHNYENGYCTRCGVEESNILDSGMCGNNIKWTLDNSGTLTLSGIGDIRITGLFAPWYDSSSLIKAIKIENGITGIGFCVFLNCGELISVDIPAGVTIIDDFAFAGCTKISDVCFGGTEEQWNTIEIGEENLFITGASIKFSQTHTHNYVTTVSTPTCTEQGYTTYICECGVSYVDDYTPALGHDFGAWYETVAPSCTQKGMERRDCSRCDEYETRQVEMLSHDIELRNAKEATCTEAGYTGDLYCKRCKETIENGESITKLDHDFGAWKQTNAPTCTQKGIETRYCSRCEATETRDISATGHHYTAVVTKPTCTEKGYTTHTCSCGDVKIDTYVAELGHNYGDWYETQAATCTEKGTEQHDCSRCEDYEMREIAALGHDWDSGTVTTQPTETSTGVRIFHCSRCPETKTETIPMLTHTHSYTDVVTPPTCTEQGYTTHTCSICGDSYKDSYVDPLNHSYSYTATKEPRTSATGTLTGTCSRCKDTTTVTLPKLSTTNYSYKVTKAPTCTATGTADYTWKTTSYGAFTFTVTLAKISHNYTAVVTQPTCTEQGYTTYTCACGDSYKDNYVNALGHKTETRNAKAATCTEEGYIGEEVCKVCGQIIHSGVSVKALGHAWDEGKVTIQPTEEKDGVKTYTCTRCGETKTEAIPAIDHVHNYIKAVTAPTCTAEGYTTYTCSTCGDSYKSDFKAKATHKTVIKNAKTATCTAEGYTGDKVCTVCSTVVEQGKTIAKLAHGYQSTVIEPSAEAQGYTKHTCTKCGDSYMDNYTVAEPTVTIKNTASSGKPTLKWAAVDGAVKYEVYRATSKTGKYTKMYTTSSTSYTNTSAVPGSTYYYKVKAVAANGKASDFSAIKSITCDCAQPVVTISTVASSGKVKLSWSAVDGASKYEIYRATSKTGTYSKLYTTSNTNYTNSSAVAGKTYYYKVKALCDKSSTGNSAYSAVKSITCDCAKPIVTITTVASSGKVKLSWSAVDGASKYEIWRATSKDGTYTKLYTTSSTSYTNSSAVAGKTYYYKVKALCDKSSAGNSAYSAIKSITCDCARPVVKIITSSGHPKLIWAAVDGATKYEIWRATSKTGTYTKLYTTTKTSYTNSSAKAGTTYYYKVKAVCGATSNGNSANSTVVSIKAK